jgi:lysozyme
MKKKHILGAVSLLLPFGFLIYVLGSWFYTYLTDPENAPSVTDLPGIAVSYLRRGWLIVKGKTEIGASADPISIATGLIAGFEGFSPKAYADPPGQIVTYSIGYGHQIVPGDGFDKGSTISESDASALLSADLETYASCVNNAVEVDLTPSQLAALYSFCYNEGCHAFQNSTLLKDVNAKNFDDVTSQFARWDIAEGTVSTALVDRRAKEAALFAS